MMRTTAIALFLACACACAQDPPRATPADPETPLKADPVLQPDPGNDWFQLARNVYDSAQASKDLDGRADLFNRAASQFTDYLAQYANHPNAEPAWWYLGQCHYFSGRPDEAKRCFSTLINRYGSGKWVAAAAYTMAADHYNKHEYAFAAALFDKAAANAIRAEDRQRSAYYAGTSYRLLGRDREAATSFQAVLREKDANESFVHQTKLGLAALQQKAGKPAEALALFQDVADHADTPATRGEGALQAALAASKLGKPELADRYLNLLLNTPGMEAFRADAGLALMANEAARKNHRRVIEIYRSGTPLPDAEKEAQRLTFAAQSFLALNDLESAAPIFRSIERSVPPEHNLAFEASYYRLLCFYRSEGKHLPDQVDAFLQIYSQSRKKDPKLHTALLMKAEALFAEKKTREAAKTYSEIDPALLSPKNRPGFLYQRGWCLAEAGDPQGAVRSLDRFLNENPDDKRAPLALAKRAKALAATGETQRASDDFETLIRLKPDPEITAFAWLEAARLKKSANDLPGMISHYRGLLDQPKLPDVQAAEAHYWIGWGLIKQDHGKDAPPHLEQARKLRPDTFAKHAGLLLILHHFASQELDPLCTEISRAIDGKYQDDIPTQALRWAGLQAFNANRHADAARILGLLAHPDDPRSTPKDVWRYLGKSLLETGKPADALAAAEQVLAVEDNSSWKADALLDQGRALAALHRDNDATKAADAALELRPQGPTNAGLRILKADIAMRANDPATAAAQLAVVPEFIDDPKLTPLALHKLAEALDKKGDKEAADKARESLAKRFPGWTNPAQAPGH